jgi:hypothetical protein
MPSASKIRSKTAPALLLLCLFAAPLHPQAAPAAAPTVDQILDRYIAALGGRAALEKQTSRVSMGTIEVPAMHLNGTVLIHEKAPNKSLQVIIISGNVFRQGFDGAVGWTDGPPDGTRRLSGDELADASRDADFLHPLHLRQIYSALRFVGTEKIGDAGVFRIDASYAGESDPDRLYFDVRTGLPLRLVSQRHTEAGLAEITEDFQDYRDVDGIQLPFTILQSGGDADLVIRISEVHHGVALDDGEFAMPAVN